MRNRKRERDGEREMRKRNEGSEEKWEMVLIPGEEKRERRKVRN